MRAALPLLVLLLVGTPFAVADHAWSHRLYVEGRVVDAHGTPAAGLPIEVVWEGVEARACFDEPPARTNATGDYRACFRAGALTPDAEVEAHVSAGGANVTASLDPRLRRAVAHLRLPGDAPGRDLEGARLFQRTFLVTGRVAQVVPQGIDVDGAQVYALPREGEPVRVVLLRGNATLAEANATTDTAGVYEASLSVAEVPPGATIYLEAGGLSATRQANATLRRADVDLVSEPFRPDLRHAPGSETPLPAGVVLAALALAALARVSGGAGRRRR